MTFKISYNYEITAQSKTEARELMARARANGTDEELFTYVSIRPMENHGLLAQVKQQLVG